MTRTVLVTGGSGFVGRQILRELSARDVRIRAVRRPGAARPLDASVSVERVIESPDLFAEPASWWADVCAGVDTIIHAAWYAEPGKYLQSPKNLDCLAGTLNLARGAVEADVEKFVGIGTCVEYDLTPGHLSVDTPLKPTTPYGGAKAAAFLALTPYFAPPREFAWCRLFYLYGEGEDNRRLVPYVREKLAAGQPAELTSGNQIRDYLDVREAGRMIVDVALGNRQGPVNICSGRGITVREMVERIADEYGRRDLLRFGVRPDNFVDPPCVVGIP